MSITSFARAQSPDGPGCGTKTLILEAAARLFATRGLEATSLRAITAEAGVNLGAVNYHFKSKHDLIIAVLGRIFQPVNERRLRMLDKIEASGKPPTVEAILDALFRPPFEVVSQPTEAGWYFSRLLAFCLTEPGAYLKPLVEQEFALKTQRFHEAFQRACPRLSRAETRWRLHYALGAFTNTVGNPQLLEITSQGLCRADDPEEVLSRIISFCAAGFRAGKV